MSSSYQSSYVKYAPIAMQVPETSLQPYRGDARLALVNIRIGIESVLGTPERIAELRNELPAVPIDDVLELPELAKALLYATGKTISRRASTGDIDAAITKVSALRSQFLKQAELLAARGKLDKDVVANIRKGTGKCDMAQDGMELAGLYADNAAEIAGLHPFTSDDIEILRTQSEWLLDHLKPTGARKKPVSKTEEGLVRDGLWTMIVPRHAWLRKVGYYVFGDAFETYTPKLQSRILSASAGQQAEVMPANPTN